MAGRRGMLPLNETLPMEGRASLLPFRDTLPGSVMNERSWALPGMLAGAWNAFTAPRRAWTGALDPTGPEAIEEAMNVAGYAAAGGMPALLAGRGLPPGGMLGVNVFHGSPHKFDRFDAAHIGRGEGAQAYGHGLYFAEDPKVAGFYRDTFAKRADDPNAYSGLPALPSRAEMEELSRLTQQMTKRSNLPPEEMRRWRELKTQVDVFQAAVDAQRPKAHLYKVDLPDEMAGRMLDWDKPLSQQPESVQRALRPFFAGDFKSVQPRDGMPLAGGGTLRVVGDADFGPRYFLEFPDGKRFKLAEKDLPNLLGQGGEGRAMFQSMKDRLAVSGGVDAEVSQWLRSLGIPGIRYLDQGSRAGGAGTSNYVVFPGEENALKILERE